jgi:Ca-activated chloride channel homolog
MRKISFLLVVFLLFVFGISAQEITEGSLFAVNKKGVELGACPLKRTAVKTDISGFLARVTVTQEFENNFSEPIEAVYTFPLSQNSAVDAMTMKIGERVIRGQIRKREEARKVYEQAKTDGKTASLLDQERPNIFTQSVANILPNEKIFIEISYVETLKYEAGAYEFVFPMVVAPRYSPDSAKEEDAQTVSPTVAPTRAGHNISIEVNLDAGVPVEEIRSTSHEIESLNLSPNSAKISLKSIETIPNKDFILRYDVSGKRIEDAILTNRGANGGFFTMILQPPDNFAVEDVTPKEIVFVLDTSGSMSGFPIEKAKEAMKLSLEGLYPHDTFNLITFAGDTKILFDAPVPATQANLERAKEFMDSEGAGGGTEMMKAIKTALAPTASQEHIRIVCFMTDGYVDNEAEIIREIQKHPKARVFSFGIGDSVNRFLLEKMARTGRGEAEFITLEDDGSKAARKFYERVHSPLLTDISIDWNGLPVADIYPNRLSDLFSAKPVVLHGRYTRGASGTIKLKGKVSGQDYVREIAVNFPENESRNDVLATLWARTKIDDLMNQTYIYDADEEEFVSQPKAKTIGEIVQISLKYNILTQFTSFVAVEERIVTSGGKTKKIKVPVYTPNGTEFEEDSKGDGIGSGSGEMTNIAPSVQSVRLSTTVNGQTVILNNVDESPVVSPKTVPKTVSGGVVNGKARNLVTPVYPSAASSANASGQVAVQVTIDESGKVISTNVVSGNPLLRSAAEQAAKSSTFSPTMLSGQPVKVTGIIVYNFTAGSNSATAAVTQTQISENQTKTQETPLTEAQKAELNRRQMLAEKLHFWVFALVERLQNGASAITPNESKFVREGKAEIQIQMTAKTPEAIKKLQDAGFEITDAKIIAGKIAIEKLASLAEIAEVQYILPNLK